MSTNVLTAVPVGQEKNDYANSNPFDYQLTCEAKAFSRLTDELAGVLGLSAPRDLQQLRVLLANLLAAHREGRDKWVAVPRNRNSFAPKRLPKRYNPAGVSYRLVKISDRLTDHGFVKFKNGFRDRGTRQGICLQVAAHRRIKGQIRFLAQ